MALGAGWVPPGGSEPLSLPAAVQHLFKVGLSQSLVSCVFVSCVSSLEFNVAAYDVARMRTE